METKRRRAGDSGIGVVIPLETNEAGERIRAWNGNGGRAERAIEHIVRLSQDARISTRFPEELLDHYKRAVTAGLGDQELPAVFRTLTQD